MVSSILVALVWTISWAETGVDETISCAETEAVEITWGVVITVVKMVSSILVALVWTISWAETRVDETISWEETEAVEITEVMVVKLVTNVGTTLVMMLSSLVTRLVMNSSVTTLITTVLV